MSNRETDADDGSDRGQDDSDRGVSRRDSLAMLGAVGALGALSGCNGSADESETPTTRAGTATATDTSGGSSARRWDRDVDAAGHTLSNVGALGFEGDDQSVRGLTGGSLTVGDDGALSVDDGVVTDFPAGYHVVSEYPGDTLDQKLSAAIEAADASSLKTGHRFVVSPPDPTDPAATDEGTWRFEDPVVIDRDRGGYYFDFGRTHVQVTSEIDSLFVIGPDEKAEGITMSGGVFGAGGNLGRSFIDVQGIGHMIIENMYLAGGVSHGRNSVPAGIRLADAHGTSELTVTNTEVTGCTDGFLATPTADVPFAAAFDLDIFNFRAGGGETSVRIDGGVGVNLHSIQAGGHPVQSVSDSIVRFENSRDAVRKSNVSVVRERHNSMGFHSGVRAVDVTDGSGPRHDGISVQTVDVQHAQYGTDLNYVDHFDQQTVRPPPAPVGARSSGASRWTGRKQVFDSTRGHEFRADGTARLSVDGQGVRIAGAGSGPILTTPDGSSHYRLRVANDGSLVTEAVTRDATGSVGPSSPADVTLIDDFEDGDLSEYTGATGDYAVTTDAPVGEGQYSLKAQTTGSGPIVSTSGLADYPAAGDTLAAKVAQTEVHPFVGVAWGVQDVENFYWVRIDTTANALQLWRMENGTPTKLGGTYHRLDDVGTVYEFVIEWGVDGVLTAALCTADGREVASVRGQDTAFAAGGVGLRQGGMLDHLRFW